MFKYLITYWIEKLHRYCFDNIYVQGRKMTVKDKIILRIFDICYKIIPDYREYLNKWHIDKKYYYLRYKTYEW